MLKINRLIRNSVFREEFAQLETDNEIAFPASGIAVVYGPNGIGKTSLARTFAGEEDTEFDVSFDGKRYSSSDEVTPFHVINDQNGRNIIEGSTKDFILGDNIRREYELKDVIEAGFKALFNDSLISRLKEEFSVSKKEAPLIEYVKDSQVREYVSDLANRRSKGRGIDRMEFLKYVGSIKKKRIPDYDQDKMDFLLQDINDDNSAILRVLDILDRAAPPEMEVTRIEETSDAVTMLNKYYYLSECVVCDTRIDRKGLMASKQESHARYLNSLSEESREAVESLNQRLSGSDPFGVKRAVTSCAIEQDVGELAGLIAEIQQYLDVANLLVEDMFARCLEGVDLLQNMTEYESIVKDKPSLTDEDVLFIEKFVNDCIDRHIELRRDDDGNLNLLLGGEPFLNEKRENLRLSNGEQNFISIAFELLKAKKLDAAIVVLDDPISSFDSIYKNKIIYAISKFLENKKQILLTHNVDLVKLLEHQRSQSFSLYLLNNTLGERNGFIAVSNREQKLLLYLHEFVNFLREDATRGIKNEEAFLVSLAPFMRSFSNVVNRKDIRDSLTSIMHGYGVEQVDLAELYQELFKPGFTVGTHLVSVERILGMRLESIEILDARIYPLLNRALCHVLAYLWLRLYVEKSLVDQFGINTNQHDQLTRIILKAFPGSSETSINGRVFLLSRKTLLNEFNHFEQDLNVFQPALDITDSALKKEREDIIAFIERISASA